MLIGEKKEFCSPWNCVFLCICLCLHVNLKIYYCHIGIKVAISVVVLIRINDFLFKTTTKKDWKLLWEGLSWKVWRKNNRAFTSGLEKEGRGRHLFRFTTQQHSSILFWGPCAVSGGDAQCHLLINGRCTCQTVWKLLRRWAKQEMTFGSYSQWR